MKNGNVSAEQLKSIIERIERLEEEKSAIAYDIRDIYYEAKGNGFDTKAIRQIIRLRKLDNNERDEQEYLLDVYKAALGMIPELDDDTPLTRKGTLDEDSEDSEDERPKRGAKPVFENIDDEDDDL